MPNRLLGFSKTSQRFVAFNDEPYVFLTDPPRRVGDWAEIEVEGRVRKVIMEKTHNGFPILVERNRKSPPASG